MRHIKDAKLKQEELRRGLIKDEERSVKQQLLKKDWIFDSGITT